jgi:hypothetical protein
MYDRNMFLSILKMRGSEKKDEHTRMPTSWAGFEIGAADP